MEECKVERRVSDNELTQMSNFIPMVSSSPPPLEDGGGFDDWDDDFGNFMGADSSPAAPVIQDEHSDGNWWGQDSVGTQQQGNSFADFGQFQNNSDDVKMEHTSSANLQNCSDSSGLKLNLSSSISVKGSSVIEKDGNISVKENNSDEIDLDDRTNEDLDINSKTKRENEENTSRNSMVDSGLCSSDISPIPKSEDISDSYDRSQESIDDEENDDEDAFSDFHSSKSTIQNEKSNENSVLQDEVNSESGMVNESGSSRAGNDAIGNGAISQNDINLRGDSGNSESFSSHIGNVGSHDIDTDHNVGGSSGVQDTKCHISTNNNHSSEQKENHQSDSHVQNSYVTSQISNVQTDHEQEDKLDEDIPHSQNSEKPVIANESCESLPQGSSDITEQGDMKVCPQDSTQNSVCSDRLTDGESNEQGSQENCNSNKYSSVSSSSTDNIESNNSSVNPETNRASNKEDGENSADDSAFDQDFTSGELDIGGSNIIDEEKCSQSESSGVIANNELMSESDQQMAHNSEGHQNAEGHHNSEGHSHNTHSSHIEHSTEVKKTNDVKDEFQSFKFSDDNDDFGDEHDCQKSETVTGQKVEDENKSDDFSELSSQQQNTSDKNSHENKGLTDSSQEDVESAKVESYDDWNSVGSISKSDSPDLGSAQDEVGMEQQNASETEFDDFADFSAAPQEGDSDFDDFADFNSAPSEQQEKTESAQGDSEKYADFNSPSANKTNESQSTSSFSNEQFAAFQDTTVNSTEGGDDWATFQEPATVPTLNDEDDDDDFGDFDEVKSESHNQEDKLTLSNQLVRKKELTAQMVNGCFPNHITSGLQESDSGLLENYVETLSSDGKLSSQSQGLSPDFQSKFWTKLKKLDSAQRLKWNDSTCNKKLFSSLGIDTRNILIGRKKQSVPIYAANLTMLEPTKGPLKPTSAKLDATLVDTNKTEEPQANTYQSQSSRPPVQNKTSKSSDLPPVQFDWTSSGLTNPLESNSKTLNLDFLVMQENEASVKNGVFESELMHGQKASLQPLENILANLKTSTIRRNKQTESLGEEATRIMNSLPDLSFMQAKVLMFPLRQMNDP